MSFDLNFMEILWLIIAFFVWIIAVRITFTFDINKYIENRKDNIKSKSKNYCTHSKFVKIWESYGIQSTFVSPSWTLSYYCEKCWLIKNVIDEREENQRLKYYMNNIDEYKKQEKKFEKLLKKWWFI